MGKHSPHATGSLPTPLQPPIAGSIVIISCISPRPIHSHTPHPVMLSLKHTSWWWAVLGKILGLMHETIQKTLSLQMPAESLYALSVAQSPVWHLTTHFTAYVHSSDWSCMILTADRTEGKCYSQAPLTAIHRDTCVAKCYPATIKQLPHTT